MSLTRTVRKPCLDSHVYEDRPAEDSWIDDDLESGGESDAGEPWAQLDGRELAEPVHFDELKSEQNVYGTPYVELLIQDLCENEPGYRDRPIPETNTSAQERSLPWMVAVVTVECEVCGRTFTYEFPSNKANHRRWCSGCQKRRGRNRASQSARRKREQEQEGSCA